MNEKPVLVIMAAGMGSRYGGLKQMDPVGPDGEFILDYSLFDARRAGFGRAVLVIKRENEEDFRRLLCNRVKMPISFAYQELTDLPEGYAVPDGRVKPWGTGHAVLCCRGIVDGPFAVINADDYYGPEAFKNIFAFLSQPKADNGKHHYCMVGYRVENTVTDHGTVARGVSQADENGYLKNIVERLKIEKTATAARFTEDDGKTWTDLPAGTLVRRSIERGLIPDSS